MSKRPDNEGREIAAEQGGPCEARERASHLPVSRPGSRIPNWIYGQARYSRLFSWDSYVPEFKCEPLPANAERVVEAAG